MTSSVQLVDVSKRFPAPHQAIALDRVSLKVEPGERIAIIGASGSGKSTLLAILGLLERPSDGSILFEGRNVAALSDRSLSRIRALRIGFVFQAFYLLERLTALDNVAEALVYAGVRRRDRRDLAAPILEAVGLGSRVEHYPYQLSGGERQRVAIARALVKEPKLLLADEPTGDLDPVTGSAVIDLMLGAAQKATVVIVTHSPSVAEKLDRVITLDAGVLVKDGRSVS